MADIEVEFKLDPAMKRSLFAAFKTMDQQANIQLKNEVVGLTTWMAGLIKMAAADSPWPRQASVVATTVKARKDRLPYISVGGSKVVTKSGATAGELVKGAEFGGPAWFKNGGRRFPFRSPRRGRGNEGYWIFPTVRNHHDELATKWHDLVEKYVENPWGRNG